jgi:hypothetical protein
LAYPPGAESSANDPDDRIILTIGGPEGKKLAYLIPTPTGGWSSFAVQTFNAGALNAYAGNTVDLYFTFEGTGYIVDIDSFRIVPARTQAENYDVQSGTQLTGGGTAVGYINAGDYIGFLNYQLPDSFDDVEIVLAVPESANDPDDRIILTLGGPDGLKLAYLIPSPTGGWSDFQVQRFNAGALNAYAGNTIDLYFTFEGTGFVVDIDSFRFIPTPPAEPPLTEAENYDVQSGTQLTGGGTAVGYINAGDYIGFLNYQLPDSFDDVEIVLAVPESANDPDDRIILTLGGPDGLKLAYLIPSPTGGWSDFQVQRFNAGALNAYAGNTIDLYFTFEGTGYIVDIDSFRFIEY